MKGEFVMLSKFISSLKQEFGGYNAAALTKDLMAGLTVAAVARLWRLPSVSAVVRMPHRG